MLGKIVICFIACCSLFVCKGAAAEAPESQIVNLTESNFIPVIAKGVTLVDFYADWCGFCVRLMPLIEELENDFQGVAVIAKHNIDTSKAFTTIYGVTAFPTLILFKDGQEVGRFIGGRDKETLKNWISNAL